jgi:hypothetical protein
MPKCDPGDVFAMMPAAMVISGGYWMDLMTFKTLSRWYVPVDSNTW